MKAGKPTLHQLLQAGLVLVAVVDIVFLGWLTDYLTMRGVDHPTGIYLIPYATHGGTVFISASEWAEKAFAYIVGGALVLGQLWLNRARRRE